MTRILKGSAAGRISSARGMSVVEVIVAFSVIALVALASATFYNQQRNLLGNFTPNGECKSVLEGQMSYFRQQGMAPTGLPWKHDPPNMAGAATNAVTEPSRYNDAWLMNNKRFAPLQAVPLVRELTGPGIKRSEVSNYPLQRGAMGILNALYNFEPGICNAGGVDPANLGVADALTPKPDDKTMADFQSTMQVQQIDLSSRAPLACLSAGQQSWVRPKGIQENDPNRPYEFPANVHPDRGYRVTLNGTYKDRTGAAKSCSLTEDFNYPVDQEAQSLSVIWSTTEPDITDGVFPPEATRTSPPRPVCSHTAGKSLEFTLKIGFPTTAQIETGTVFLCKDVSEQMNPNYCEEKVNSNYPRAATNAVMQGNNYNTPLAGPPRVLSDLPQKWVPCSQVTACGVKPFSYKAKEVDPVNAPGSTTYELTYKNDTSNSRDGLWGCDIRIDVASVDLAGNFKILSASSPGSESAHRYFQPVDCYKCFKKKKRNFASFAIATIIAGPFVACAIGAGGVCRSSKGLKYQGHSCQNSLAGADVCIKEPVKRPSWRPNTDPMCPAMPLTLPTAYGGANISIPSSPAGTIFDEPHFVDSVGGYCEVQAICDPSGHWTGVPTDTGGYAPYIDCGKMWTRYKIDISGSSPGASPPTGAQECLMWIPDVASITTYDYNALYSGLDVCAPGITGESTNLLCTATPNGSGGYNVHYPLHALTGAANNKNPNEYYYMKHIIPTQVFRDACK